MLLSIISVCFHTESSYLSISYRFFTLSPDNTFNIFDAKSLCRWEAKISSFSAVDLKSALKCLPKFSHPKQVIFLFGFSKILLIIIIYRYFSGHAWQPCSSSEFISSDDAVRAGRDADGTNIYVGRAFHEGDLLPAKVIPDKAIAYVSYGGQEHPKSEFELLRFGNFVWEFTSHGAVPEGALEVGRTIDGEPLYAGRCLYEGTQTPGKVQASHGCLYIPYDGQEVKVYEYEILVSKWVAAFCHNQWVYS